ncbi:MAG: DUF2478 domain-containing protein [Cohaesibacteraceae bacterium]
MAMLGYTMMPGKGDTDLLLAAFANELECSCKAVCGCVQSNQDRSDGDRCNMFIRTLPAGEEILISQSLGPGSRGCRLDQNALERAVASVEHNYSARCDLLLINKFGKHEASGRGFRNLIAQALSDHVPVLVGLNSLNQEAFFAFACGLQAAVEPQLDDLLAWFRATECDRKALQDA